MAFRRFLSARGFSHWLVCVIFSRQIRQDVFDVFTGTEWIRHLVRKKLQDGRLPLGRAVRFWGGPGAGELCDACGTVITKDQLAIQDFVSNATATKPFLVHAGCFQIWDAERLLLPPPETAHRSGDNLVNP